MTHSASSRVIKSFSSILSSSFKKVAEFSKKGIQKLMEKIQTADFFWNICFAKIVQYTFCINNLLLDCDENLIFLYSPKLYNYRQSSKWYVLRMLIDGSWYMFFCILKNLPLKWKSRLSSFKEGNRATLETQDFFDKLKQFDCERLD